MGDNMGGWYFPDPNNLVPIDDLKVTQIWNAIRGISGKTPHKFYGEIFEEFVMVEFFVDKGMLFNDGVLGATQFFHPNRVCLSPIIVDNIGWEASGVPNNEIAMNTVIHELTHLKQMRIAFGIVYAVLNAPWFSFFTLEKWASENGDAAQNKLSDIYDEMRRNKNENN